MKNNSDGQDTNNVAGTPAPVDTTIDPVVVKLTEFGASNDIVNSIKNLGVNTSDDLAMLTETDLVGAGMKPIQARKLMASVVKPVVTDATQINAVSFDGILPSVPDDGSWLQALKTGGVLKVDQSTVISAIRAALASRVGLFDLPQKLADAMERFADSNDEPVDPVYFKLRQQLTQHAYADVFEAIPGLNGNFVTESRKKDLFGRIDKYLWPAIIGFYGQLKSWQEAWMQGAANPAILTAALLSGGRGASLPPGLMQAPDTGALRDYADAVADAINKVFSGTGVQIVSALAYDAAQTKKTLEDSRLPALVGAANRDQMLKLIKAGISPTYPRLEVNLVKFILSILQAKDQPAGNEELQYFGALFMLGSQIPWNDLGGQSIAGIGGGRVQL